MRVPFPFVEDNRRRYRPGVVVSNGIIRGSHDLLWVIMVTGSGKPAWADDVEVGPAHADFGLPIPSRIRVAKIASITTDQATVVGRLERAVLAEVMAKVDTILGRDGHPQ